MGIFACHTMSIAAYLALSTATHFAAYLGLFVADQD
jgi:hypothetical protein